MAAVLPVLAFVVLVSLLILVHEAGHFLAAKLAKVGVLEFGLGFPPRIFSLVRGETRYSVNLLPFGGFVRLLGEEGQTQDPRAFIQKGVLTRGLIIVSGVLANILLAILVLTAGFTLGMTPIVTEPATLPGEKFSAVVVTQVKDDSAAGRFGIEVGDQILGFEGAKAFSAFTRGNVGKEVEIKLKSAGSEKSLAVKLGSDQEAPLGVAILDVTRVKMSLPQAVFFATAETGKIARATLEFLGKFLGRLRRGQLAEEAGGPVAIYAYTSQAVRFGLNALAQLTVLLSVNLALLNIVPFPALDGGRLLFVIAEGLTGKPLPRHWENLAHTLGFALLIGLILAITWRDILRLTR